MSDAVVNGLCEVIRSFLPNDPHEADRLIDEVYDKYDADDVDEEKEKLEKENEKLKRQNATWLEYKNVAESDIDNMRNILGKDLAWNECLKEAQRLKTFKDEMKKLDEERESLKEAIEEMRVDKIHPLTGEIMKASDILKLEKEIRLLEDRAVADYDIHMKQYKQFKDENEKLKKQLEEVSQKEKEWWEKKHNELYEKYKKLERENRITFGAWQYEVGTLKKLEEKLEEYQSIANDYAPNEDRYMNGYGDYIGNPETLEEYINQLTKWNHEHIQEIKKLKKDEDA